MNHRQKIAKKSFFWLNYRVINFESGPYKTVWVVTSLGVSNEVTLRVNAKIGDRPRVYRLGI